MPLEWTALASVMKWVWDNFGGEIKKEFTEPAKQAWTSIVWPEKATAYGEKIKSLYGTLRILGHPRPIPLDSVFTDVYIHDRPLALRRASVKDLEEQYRQVRRHTWNEKRINGLELVRQKSKLFILGQPGVGKTTFLKHIALQAATGQIDKVPIFVSLKQLANSGKPLLDFLVDQFAILNLPDGGPYLLHLLQSGKAIVLFDGLDEVTHEQEEKLNLNTTLINFARQYDKNQILISCRTAAIDYQFEQFEYVEMADFTEEQIAAFIGKWFSDKPQVGDTCLKELTKPNHQGLYEMARNPLLLSLLCLNYAETFHFPDRRVELYEEAIDTLLKKWDTSSGVERDKTYHSLSLGRKRQIFSHIAYVTFQQGQYFAPKAKMVSHILDFLKPLPEIAEVQEDEGEAILQAIEAHHGIIVERARGVYGFAHLTFQEYFTAKYIGAIGESAWPALLSHCAEPQWHEIFLLVASLLSKADEFLLAFTTHLNHFVASDNELIALLTWANKKAQEVNSDDASVVKLALWRILYVYLDRDHNIESALGIAHATARVRHRVRNLALTFDFTFNRDLDQDLERSLDRALGLARDYTLVRDLDLALTRSLTPSVALDFALIYGWVYSRYGIAKPFIELAQKLSHTQGAPSLREALDNLVIPPESASDYAHNQLGKMVWQIAQQERQLKTFNLNKKQLSTLENYLIGSELLLQCLKLAVITDRDAILSRLLVPPPEQGAYLFN